MAGQPKKENYIECEACSKEAGEPVVYHKSALMEDGFLFERGLQCPKGHPITAEGVKA